MSESAQEQHDRIMEGKPFKIPSRQVVERSTQENEYKASSPPRDLVELIMLKHGFTRSQAEDELELFGA